MPDLRVVERRHAERVRLLLVELHVVLAVRDELAPQHDRVHAVLPRHARADVSAITGERSYDDARHLVASLVLGIVERLLLAVEDPVRRRRLVALEREL